MYSMEKLARGTIRTKKHREKIENDLKVLFKIKYSRLLKEKTRRGNSVKFAEYKDRPRGKLEK